MIRLVFCIIHKEADMKFTKMHGLGNDYVYVDCTKQKIKNPNKLSEIISKYHFGIGSDGLVMIMNSDKADFSMRMFNADGSEGKMCGNATRCIGKYVYDRGLTDKTQLTLETLSGIKYLTLTVVGGKVETVSVDMGKAVLSAAEIPVKSDSETVIGKTMTVSGREQNITCVSMGNPHCVIFTDGIDSLDLEKIGPGYENDEIFPERVNTEFVEIKDRNTLRMRVWERGSGETMACGTGACAVAVAAVENGFCDRGSAITVHLRGGDLSIVYRTDGHVIMTGGASFVFDGELLIKEAEEYI